MGLSQRHHGELNAYRVPKSLYDDLRREYADDPVALQQIDVYDPGKEYHRNFRLYVDATKSNDKIEIDRLEAWFVEHYPDIK